jgi:twitching motility protein PilU
MMQNVTLEKDQAARFMNELMALMVEKKASDMFITVGYPPAIKVDGTVRPVSEGNLGAEHTMALTRALMNDRQAADFEKNKEANFAVAPPGIGRFRVNVFMQQGYAGMVLRVITNKLPTLEELGLPPVLAKLAETKRGLIIFVGGTGTGKTTSLAAFIDYRNRNSSGHIVTLEDPIEFVHPHKKCIVTQREIGLDTDGWGIALKNTLRQAPDVILMGEIRDRETMDYAVAFAETGHLCLATLHANSANQAIDRIVNFFPQERHAQLLMDLSMNLRAMISQRLIPLKAGRGRAAAIEIMVNTPRVADLIFKGNVSEIKEAMKLGSHDGMQTFDQALFRLYDDGVITYGDALRFADSQNDLRLNIKLNSREAKKTDFLSHADGMSLVETIDSIQK